ncbi:MAG: T9SS type A sorting domain-containing protein [Fidelibacterota bacterium]|nr:MAG: T9SS type A sorting domain-containing protein [Candidatus Neomarinimicrobiota bacterium]
MRISMISNSLLILITLGLATASAQWEVYDCDLLPQYTDGWHESNATNDDGATEIMYVMEDPDIPGNKILVVDSREVSAGFEEEWKYLWGGNANTGMTLVFRAVALDTAVFDRDLCVEPYNGVARERILTKENGTVVKFDKAAVETDIDATVWHIYRITTQVDQFELFIDEDPLSYMTVTGQTNVEKYFRFGDCGGDSYGAKYDWFAWDTTGAYPPGQGTDLPDTLAGLAPASVEGADLPPRYFELGQNYPNPFNPATEIRYEVSEAAAVRLAIYDLTGRLVHTLVNEMKQPGTYHVQWDGRNANGNLLHSGVYFYSLQTGRSSITKKMLFLK